jgi:hypothetical protein
VVLTGAQLERLIHAQLPQWLEGRRGLPGLAGLRVAVDCAGTPAEVRLTHDRKGPLAPDEPLVIAMASATVGRFAATQLAGEPEIAAAEIPVLVRDAVAAWLLERGGRIAAVDFSGRWQLPPQATSC